MTSASIDLDKLQTLITTLRQSNLPPKERRRLIDDFLKAVDIIKQEDCERLLCIAHAARARGWKNRSSVYRSGDRHGFHVFKVCCRQFFSRLEIERAPKSTGKTGGVKKVRVGM